MKMKSLFHLCSMKVLIYNINIPNFLQERVNKYKCCILFGSTIPNIHLKYAILYNNNTCILDQNTVLNKIFKKNV